MKHGFHSRDLSGPTLRRLELALAMAEEQLLRTHMQHALDLIEIAGEDIPFDTILDIYCRLLRLDPDENRILTTHVLARLGERAEGERAGPPRAAPADEPEAGTERGRRSILEGLKQRLRGRENEQLRRAVEFLAARAEVAALETHIRGALHFAEILDTEMPVEQAVDLYIGALGLRESIAEVVYCFALARWGEVRVHPASRSSEDPGLGRSRSSSPGR